MSKITTVGIDLAKPVFALHGINLNGGSGSNYFFLGRLQS
jgi:hypothetical protein